MPRILGVAALAVLAGLVGVASVFVARMGVSVAGVPVPWGLALAVAAPAALFRAGGHLLGRTGALAPAMAWLAVVVVALLPRSGGDIVLANDGYGLGFLLLALAVVGWTAVRATAGRR